MKLTLEHNHKLPTGALGLAIDPDGHHAFASCADGAVYDVDIASGSAEPFQDRHPSFASGCVLLPDRKTLISAGYDGMLMWHDLTSRRCWRRVKAHRFWSWQIALSSNGRRLATVTGQYLPGGWKYEPAPEEEPSVKVFDTHNGELIAAFGHQPPVLSCTFSPDGRYLAAGNMMGEVRVWDLEGEKTETPICKWTSADFTSWGTIKTHHYCGGIYSLAFAPNSSSLLGCGMGPMRDPMAGNGKMTWQRWNWKTGKLLDQIKDGQHGSGLMETLAFHPDGSHFVMAGKQAQGTWNAALFGGDGNLVHSLETKNRITKVRFADNGQSLILTAAHGQPKPKDGKWPSWGRVQLYKLKT